VAGHGKRWAFAYNEKLEIMDETEHQEPRSVQDWPKWNDAIQEELDSLRNQEVFGHVTRTPNATGSLCENKMR
jgi:hypothetical protein